MVLFIVRYSEIGLKGPKKRSEMERRLISNIRSALDNMDIKITRERGRLFVEALKESDEMHVQESLSHVFGVKSFSKCKRVKFRALDDLIDLSFEEFRDFVNGKKFAVRVRRTGNHDFSSIQVERLLGERLYPFSSGVNLKNPEAEVQMEIRENTVYLYNNIISGPGGFPLGTQGRMVSLVSGGIDSPVASWMLMKRGCQIDVVFCSLASPIDTLEFLGTVKPLADVWSYGSEMRIHIFDCSPLVESMIHGEGFLHPNVGFKKFIYEVAGMVAERIGAYGIITGESIGQVSSQTAENLAALSATVKLPVHRPLIGFDKDEIVDMAKRIGTFPKESMGEFCSIFSLNPSVSVKREELENDNVSEEVLDAVLKSEIVLGKSQIDGFIRDIKTFDLRNPSFLEGSVIVDLRDETKYREWHPQGAINYPISTVNELPRKYGYDKTFLFYCSQGLMSAYASSKLTKLGVKSMFTDEKKLKKIFEQRKKIIKN